MPTGRPWETTSQVDWELAVAREAVIRPLAELDKLGRSLVEEAMRRPLLGIVTDRAFRWFVDDLLLLLVHYVDPHTPSQNDNEPDTLRLLSHSRLAVITDLMTSAAPTSHARQRRSRSLRSRMLWTRLLRQIPADAGERVVAGSRRWPVALQRRFASALRHQQRVRWPYSPWQGLAVRPRFECREMIGVWDFRARERPTNGESGI